ncbi:MAG: hypothetical protein U0871_04595 [Gemmataceae bacterium]
MEPRLINPFLHAAPSPGVAAFPRPGKREPVYARLPAAPVTGSPVPGLTSLYHNPDPGPWGDRRYPGNCSGNLIRDLLRFYRPGTVYDPMSGSGTCRDVCKDLGVSCYSGDIHAGFDACEPHFTGAFGFCWVHPPYYRQKLYADDPRDLSREPTLDGFLTRYEQLVRACAQAVVPGGQVAVLMGDYTDREYGFLPLVFYTKLLAFRAGLRQCATDIIRFSHGATSGRKAYRSAFIPGLHDTCCVFEKPAGREGV